MPKDLNNVITAVSPDVLAARSDVSSATPATSDSLTWNGTAWAPTTPDATLPRGVVDHDTSTSNSSGTTTNTDWYSLTTPSTDGTRRWKIDFTGWVSSDTANDTVKLRLMEGAAILQETQHRITAAGGNGQQSLTSYYEGVIASGTHTYKLNIIRAAGAGTVTAVANSDHPSFLTVTDIGT